MLPFLEVTLIPILKRKTKNTLQKTPQKHL